MAERDIWHNPEIFQSGIHTPFAPGEVVYDTHSDSLPALYVLEEGVVLEYVGVPDGHKVAVRAVNEPGTALNVSSVQNSSNMEPWPYVYGQAMTPVKAKKVPLARVEEATEIDAGLQTYIAIEQARYANEASQRIRQGNEPELGNGLNRDAARWILQLGELIPGVPLSPVFRNLGLMTNSVRARMRRTLEGHGVLIAGSQFKTAYVEDEERFSQSLTGSGNAKVGEVIHKIDIRRNNPDIVPITQETLAGIIARSRGGTKMHILKALSQAGLIETRNNFILIKNREILAHVAETGEF